MFHVKHIDFERSKTVLLHNMPCLQLFFVTRSTGATTRFPPYHAVPIGTTPTIAIAPQTLTKEPRMVFPNYRERARSHTARRYACTCISLNTFIGKASSENTSQHTRGERLAPFRTHIRNHPYFYRQHIPFRKQNRQVHENAPYALPDSPAKTTKTSINIDFLPLFHIKHRLKSGVLPSLSPSDLPPRHPAVKRQGV